MEKRKSTFERLIALLQGASWALIIVGAFSLFSSFSSFGILFALVAAFIGALPGFLFLTLLELGNIQIEKLQELKKQTRLLEEMSLAHRKDKDETLSHN